MKNTRYSVSQVAIGMGSLFTAIAMLVQPEYSFLMFISIVLRAWEYAIILPVTLIVFGLVLLLRPLDYYGYRVMAAPLIVTSLFSVARISVLQPDWWVTTIVLLTLAVGLLVSRRA